MIEGAVQGPDSYWCASPNHLGLEVNPSIATILGTRVSKELAGLVPLSAQDIEG